MLTYRQTYVYFQAEHRSSFNLTRVSQSTNSRFTRAAVTGKVSTVKYTFYPWRGNDFFHMRREMDVSPSRSAQKNLVPRLFGWPKLLVEFHKRRKSRKSVAIFSRQMLSPYNREAMCADTSTFISLSLSFSLWLSSLGYFRHSLTHEKPAVAPKFSKINGCL